MPTTENASNIPLIDLKGLHGPDSAQIIKQIGQACEEYGFFLVKNHGVAETLINNVLGVAKEFFKLPETERFKFYSEDPTKEVGLTSGFKAQTSKVYLWREALRISGFPVEEFVNGWPTNPPSFRKEFSEYCRSIRKLELELLEAISESLGLEKDYIEKILNNHAQRITINYYPPCPNPDDTTGVPPHTDPTVLDILLPDVDVPGLQILKNGQWVEVNPVPNTLVVNVGDLMQVLTNDRYKSVLHQAVVNSNRERISIGNFDYPSPDGIIGPAKELIDHDHPAIYRNFTFGEFYEKLWQRSSGSRCLLDLFKSS